MSTTHSFFCPLLLALPLLTGCESITGVGLIILNPGLPSVHRFYAQQATPELRMHTRIFRSDIASIKEDTMLLVGQVTTLKTPGSERAFVVSDGNSNLVSSVACNLEEHSALPHDGDWIILSGSRLERGDKLNALTGVVWRNIRDFSVGDPVALSARRLLGSKADSESIPVVVDGRFNSVPKE